ncbi:MAG: thiamine pyrophosphate-dependent enzyme [Candidatus Entotheonellia bacterium]
MAQNYDGGEAILDGFRRLGIDYIISSPGSEWPSVWDALARQQATGAQGPKYLNCWHESLAVAMALGYTSVTGRLQAVLLHTGVGLLQGSLAIHAANQGEVPLLVCSGESITYGENPAFDPGSQWFRGLSVVGGPHRLVEPVVKWGNQVSSPYTLHETVIRAGEMAQRVPKGPVYLDIPIEVMMAEWSPRRQRTHVPPPPKLQPTGEAIARVAELLAESRNPVILTETCARPGDAYSALLQLAELLSIPVVESGAPQVANFPKDHPLHLGFDAQPFLDQADLFLVIGNKAPWYPPSASPAKGTIVVIDENPLKRQMVYQTLQADHYLEGDVATTLRLLADALQGRGAHQAPGLGERRAHWEAEHHKLYDDYRAAAAAAANKKPVDPIWLCTALSEAMPRDAVYVEETIVHRPAILRHVAWNGPQSYFHPPSGLGLGLGMALGVKLAMPERPVVALMGDGSFLYNPIVQSLGASQEHQLPLLIVVFNNGGYASMKRMHQQFYPQGASVTSGIFPGVKIPGPNYARLVEPFGGYGERVEEPGALKAALQNALTAVNSGRMALLDVAVSA